MARNRSENPVVLSRIYTRTGDDGSTALADGSRTAKTDTRLAAYADVEEANCAIGMAITFGNLAADITELLSRVQNELFDVGADLANPVSDTPPPYPPLRIDEAYITRLESECDSYNAELPTLRSFLLPGGSPGATLLHMARTVTRRAERSAWAAVGEHGDSVSPLPAKYLNRLSDLLFILSRQANAGHEDVLWKPGGAASSQESSPVSASSPKASSMVPPGVSSPTLHSTTTMPGPRLAASASVGRRRDTTVRSRRGNTTSGRIVMPRAPNHHSSSGR